MEFIGREIRIFICEECGKTFKLELADIVREYHSGYTFKYVYCNACGKKQKISGENCKRVIEYGDEHDRHYLNIH